MSRYTKAEQEEFRRKLDLYGELNQVPRLFWWSLTRSWRLRVMMDRLNAGMNWRAAYNEARRAIR